MTLRFQTITGAQGLRSQRDLDAELFVLDGVVRRHR